MNRCLVDVDVERVESIAKRLNCQHLSTPSFLRLVEADDGSVMDALPRVNPSSICQSLMADVMRFCRTEWNYS